jgi:hypothetical protein
MGLSGPRALAVKTDAPSRIFTNGKSQDSPSRSIESLYVEAKKPLQNSPALQSVAT